MKKAKGPLYALFWVAFWTVALAAILWLGILNTTESIGLLIAWAVLVGATIYLLVPHVRASLRPPRAPRLQAPSGQSLNSACPCGSGKKYKRCCGMKSPEGSSVQSAAK